MARNEPADHRPAALDVDQDLEFQHAEWTVQRVGWFVMAAIIVLAMIGLTGAGPLAFARVSDPASTLQIEYSRFERVRAATELRIELATNGNDPVELWIADEYLNAVELQFISPDPVETRAGSGRQIYSFAPIEGATTISVKLALRPKTAGVLTGRLGVPTGEEIAFRQLVYP